MFRLVVQPNTAKAQTFAEVFITSSGIETLLVLLQREAEMGDDNIVESVATTPSEQSQHNESGLLKKLDSVPQHSHAHDSDSVTISISMNDNRTSSVSETPFSNNTRNNARNNVDDSDRVVVGIIRLIGALISKGHLKFSLGSKSDVMSNLIGHGIHETGGTMFDDKVSLLLFALLKAFQAAPNRLMTENVYTTLLGTSVCSHAWSRLSCYHLANL